MTEPQAGPLANTASARAVRWWERRWLQLVVVGLVSLSIGSAAGAAGAGDNASQISALKSEKAALAAQLDTAHDDAASAHGDAASAQAQVNSLQGQVSKAQSDAANALAVAKKQLAAQNASTVARLNAQAASLRQQAATLAREERAFRQQVSSYNDSTIPGSGLYLVGTDIAPGTYHTTGDDGDGNCYWARLSSTDTSAILDNNNTTGPTTITIYRSDKAFETDGCADWHKVG